METPNLHINKHDKIERMALVKSLLKDSGHSSDVFDSALTDEMVTGNIENFIGSVPIPVGLCGPITIDGQHAKGSFIVPMATLEGTLVASYSRGAKLINECGGCETIVYDDYFLRAVQFQTESLKRSEELIRWCASQEHELGRLIENSSCCVDLLGMSYECLGTTVIVSLKLRTGDAMGANMSSNAAGILSDYIHQHSGLITRVVVMPYPEDKKFIPSRQKGKKVIARTVLERDIYTTHTRTTLDKLHEFINNFKSLLALHGSHSLNIHAANGMAATFLALGQDMGYIGECAQVILESHFLDARHLEVSVTLPTLIVGTVGGGTGLPAFQAALSMMDCYGPGKVKKLAEIIGAMILAGEIGCASAQCAFEFVHAHETLGKNRPQTPHSTYIMNSHPEG